MTQAAEKILRDAMSLSEVEREELAEKLLETLGPGATGDYEAEWKAEIERRIEQLDSGKVKAIPWEEVRKLLHARGTSDGAH